MVYFSDNGPNGNRRNGGMRGIKGNVHDGGTRSPLYVRWPGRIAPGSKVATNAGGIDLLPTLASLAGVTFTPAKPLDGRDLSPLLRGGEVDWADRMLFTLHGNGRRGSWGVRSGSFRYYRNGELHDVSQDHGQTADMAASQPQQAARMKAAGEAFLREVAPLIVPPDPQPLPVGFAAVTHLPARDGRGDDGVKWSSIHPNSSFFTNWTAPDQRMSWDIRVERAGTYQVVRHHTCPAGDVGSRVRVSFGDCATSAVIAEAFDPPLLGAELDRNPRTESFAKEFKPLPLGTLELPAETGTLTPASESVSGATVADVRRLVLARRP